MPARTTGVILAALTPSLLTTVEVAALLRVHPKHVYRLLKRGLPARRVGDEWRFDPEAVLKWAEKRATAAGRAAPLVAANDALVAEMLLGLARRRGPPLLGVVPADSDRALALLESGEVLVAGCHGRPAPQKMGDRRLARVHLVRRELGLAARSKRRLARLEDLPRATFASRPATAGSRVLLDAALVRAGIDPVRAHRRARTYSSPEDAACAAARAEVDVAFTTRVWARRVGLEFRGLVTEAYALVVRASDLGDPRVVRLCEVAQGKAFRHAAGGQPGFDARGAGSVRYGDEHDPSDPEVRYL